MYGKLVGWAVFNLALRFQCTKEVCEFTAVQIKSFPHWEFTCLNSLLFQISASNRTKSFWLFGDEEWVPEEDFNTELPLQFPQILKALINTSCPWFRCRAIKPWVKALISSLWSMSACCPHSYEYLYKGFMARENFNRLDSEYLLWVLLGHIIRALCPRAI